MDVQLISDVHVDTPNHVQWMPSTSQPKTILVVAGDISCADQTHEVLARWSPWFHSVVAVWGNHDFWGLPPGRTQPTISSHPNIHVLNKSDVVIEGIRFCGATLWTDIPPEAGIPIREAMNDFEYIASPFGDRALSLSDVAGMHYADREDLHSALQDHTYPTVVVTHHAPSFQSIAPQYHNHSNRMLNFAYANRLEPLLEHANVGLWCHGHTHQTFDYQVYDTQVWCNPTGYMHAPNPEFHVRRLPVAELQQRHAQRQSVLQCPTDYASWWNTQCP